MEPDLPELLKQARAGDELALERVLEWLYKDPAVIRLSRSQRRSSAIVAAAECTTDVRQNGLVKIWKKFKKNHEKIPETASGLLAKALRAIKEERLDFAKKVRRYRKHVRSQENSSPLDPAMDRTSISKRREREELLRLCEAILETLPSKDKHVIKARQIDGHRFEDIAANSGETVGAVRRRYGRAMQIYKERLRDKGVTL